MRYRVFRHDGIIEAGSSRAVGELAFWTELEPFESSSGYVDPREFGEHVKGGGRYLLVSPAGDYRMAREITLREETRLVEVVAETPVDDLIVEAVE